MTAPVIVSPADPAKIAAILRAKRAREVSEAVVRVRRRLTRGCSVVRAFRAISCRKTGPDGVSIVDVEKVVAEVTARRGLAREAVLSRCRATELVLARHEIWWSLRMRYGLPFSVIGRVFKRDHTTILHGVRRWQASLDQEGQ